MRTSRISRSERWPDLWQGQPLGTETRGRHGAWQNSTSPPEATKASATKRRPFSCPTVRARARRLRPRWLLDALRQKLLVASRRRTGGTWLCGRHTSYPLPRRIDRRHHAPCRHGDRAAASAVSGPIFLTGHSAGGHLVTRMVSATTPLSQATQDRIVHTLSLSGVHDLRPLMRTAMNATLGVTEHIALSESPAMLDRSRARG